MLFRFELILIIILINFSGIIGNRTFQLLNNLAIIFFFIYNIIIFNINIRINKVLKKYMIIGGIIVIYYFFNLQSLEIKKIENALKIMLLLLYTINLMNVDFKNIKKNIFLDRIIKLILVIQYLFFISFGIAKYQGNLLGNFNVGILYLTLLSNNKRKIYIVTTLIFIMSCLTKSRTSILAIAILLITYKFWYKLIGSRKKYILFLIGIFISIFIFIYVYLYSNDILIFKYLNELSLEIFNKRFFSGRIEVWRLLLNKINENFLFGYGTGTTVWELFEFKKISTHNLYLHILMEGGIFALILWGGFFLNVWSYYWKKRKDNIVRASGSYLISTLILNIFELTFYLNQLNTGILQWTSIGIAMSVIIRNIENECNY